MKNTKRIQVFCFELKFKRDDNGKDHQRRRYSMQGDGWCLYLFYNRGAWSADSIITIEGEMYEPVKKGYASTGSNALRDLFRNSKLTRDAMYRDGWVFYPDFSPTSAFRDAVKARLNEVDGVVKNEAQ